MFLLVLAHPGCPGQIPQSRKTVVCVCVCVQEEETTDTLSKHIADQEGGWQCQTIGVLKKTHTDKYLNFISHHPLHQKLGVIRTLFNRCDDILLSGRRALTLNDCSRAVCGGHLTSCSAVAVVQKPTLTPLFYIVSLMIKWPLFVPPRLVPLHRSSLLGPLAVNSVFSHLSLLTTWLRSCVHCLANSARLIHCQHGCLKRTLMLWHLS